MIWKKLSKKHKNNMKNNKMVFGNLVFNSYKLHY